MEAAALERRRFASVRAFWVAAAEASPEGFVVERPGVLAAVVPSAPQASIWNSVVYTDGEALLAVRDELDRAYARAGVDAWTVWVPDTDRAVAEALAAAGHLLDGTPIPMGVELAAADLVPRGAIAVEEGQDWRGLALANAAAYGTPEAKFTAPLSTATPEVGRVWAVRDASGTVVSALATRDRDGDCGVYFVATRPDAGRRGLARELLRAALRAARERGCGTATLEASKAGRPVYEAVGFRALGTLQLWERRRAATTL